VAHNGWGVQSCLALHRDSTGAQRAPVGCGLQRSTVLDNLGVWPLVGLQRLRQAPLHNDCATNRTIGQARILHMWHDPFSMREVAAFARAAWDALAQQVQVWRREVHEQAGNRSSDRAHTARRIVRNLYDCLIWLR
jgi:hypothetical protein